MAFHKASRDRVGRTMPTPGSNQGSPAGGKNTGRKAKYRHKGRS